MQTEITTAAEIRTTDVLVSKNRKVAYISSKNTNANMVVLRVNGNLVAMQATRKLRIQKRG